jgi:glycosyltransferase involved in cell wall biosynthesis
LTPQLERLRGEQARESQSPIPELVEVLPKFDRSVSMLVWGYNEEELIEDFFARAFELLDSSCDTYEVLFIDDCSSDRTGSIADRIAATNPHLRVIHNAHNLGSGGAARVAIREARMDYIFWQTVDWSYDISELKRFLWFTRRYDVVLGTRPIIWRLIAYIPLVRSLASLPHRSDDWLRGTVSLANYYVLRILFGVPFRDFQNVHIYPRRLIDDLEINARSSFISPEMLFRCYLHGATFIEVPIQFFPREVGKAKGIRPRAIMRSLRDIARGFLDFGWKLRSAARRDRTRRIFRLIDAPYLAAEDIRLAAPLFRVFRSPYKRV